MIGQFAFGVNVQFSHGTVQLRHELAALVTLTPDLKADIRRSCGTQVERACGKLLPFGQGKRSDFFDESCQPLLRVALCLLPSNQSPTVSSRPGYGYRKASASNRIDAHQSPRWGGCTYPKPTSPFCASGSFHVSTDISR